MSATTLPVTRGAEFPPHAEEHSSPLEAPLAETRTAVWLDRSESLLIALLVLIVTALHVRFVTNVGGLWRDETNSVNLATLPSFAEIWRLLDYDSFPMLFFALLRGWAGIFGADDDLALRALGLITGLGIFGALWASARSFGIKWPLLSFAILGLNPMFIRYGDSTRAYGLGMLLILLTLRSFWLLVESRHAATPRRVAITTLLALASVQSLYYNSVLLLAIAAGASAVAIRTRAWRTVGIILGIGLVSAASLLPYIPMMIRMQRWKFLVTYSTDFAWLWEHVCELLGSPNRLGVWLWPALVIVGLCVAAAAGVRAWRNRADCSRNPAPALFAGVTLAVGIVVYAGFLRVLNYVTQPWYYVTLAVFVACLLEVLFATWPAKKAVSVPLRFARLAVALVMLCFAVRPAWSELPTRHTNLDLVGERIQKFATRDDLVLVPLWECAIPLSRYYRGPAEIVTIPPLSDHRFHRYDLLLEQMTTAEPLRPLFARMEEVLRGGHRVFLVGFLPFRKPDRPPPSLPPAYQDAEGNWRGGAFRKVWQIQAGYFLRTKSTGAGTIEVPIPDGASVQEYENLDLKVIQGWQEDSAPSSDSP